ncbi:helix-turn-helix transcriptional regulator [Mucilaginibacter mali]|uniref:Helix-turn-helix transcriptional regulator n=1 Tax=Mucilaginibacter mali TaxID=2740462 RepID=A0A7D4UL12_9SPHI|nr:AraC family transcriptional regulator [Mucilaginibacter mali]QKJ31342.1 helix-turn-helix transcriptional regulator [Mucilaginibacter mali]
MPKATSPRILYACYAHTSREGENFIADHIFGCVISGSQELHIDGKTYTFKAGDFRFFRKNQLCRFVKHPPEGGGEFKSLSVMMDQDTLISLGQENNLHSERPYTGNGAVLLKPNPLLRNYIESLSPYINGSGQINDMISNLKVREAVMILLETNPELKDALFDFRVPGKIDLEAYMNKNYRFNVDIGRFAYLTGRSLASFKRDFERIFHISPNRWLQQKRLDDAYYLIKEKGQKVSDVYLDVGFKDLSHFSFAFKKAFGFAPTRLAR